MSAWGCGPFDNDTACDWAYELDTAAPRDRPEVLRVALTVAAETRGYLDEAEAAEAIAAAAIVAAHLPGGPTVDPVCSPDCLRDEGPLNLPEGLAALAVRAVDRVNADDSMWRELWEAAGRLDDVMAELAPIRATLAANGNGAPSDDGAPTAWIRRTGSGR